MVISSLTARLTALGGLEPTGADRFTVAPDGRPGRMYGGETAALALAVAQRTVDADRAVHVAQAHYLRPGDPQQPLVIAVERLGDGRRFAVRRVLSP
jgi:acyl-CoA thioesterase-2